MKDHALLVGAGWDCVPRQFLLTQTWNTRWRRWETEGPREAGDTGESTAGVGGLY